MVRGGDTPDDLVLVIRACPATRQECVADLVADALRSGRLYVVADREGRPEVLFGISVFARRPGVALVEVLARFDSAPAYLEAAVGSLRGGGLDVLPTGVNPDHYDVQLVAGQREEDLEPLTAIKAAVDRLVAAAGDLRANPAYAGASGQLSEEPS
jgi:hypothetical protein